MTRRVLVSHRLPELQSGNPIIDAWVSEHLQRFVSEVFEQIRFLTPEEGEFELDFLGGAGTAGTYEIATQANRYYRIGDFVFATIDVTLAAAITGGGVGALQLGELPYEAIDTHKPVGSFYSLGVNFDTSHQVVCNADGSRVTINEIFDNGAAAGLDVGALAANDRMIASVCYVTNGVRAG